VRVVGGDSAILLGAMHEVVDVWSFRRWATPLVWIGANLAGLGLVVLLARFFYQRQIFRRV
jgi:hypothetical protein